MAFNIAAFKENGPRLGTARPTLFEVILTPPLGLVTGAEKFSFSCESASLPSSTLGKIEIPYFGRTIKVDGDRVYDDWRTTVQVDEDFTIRNLFERWSNFINRHERNERLERFDFQGYKVDLEVRQYRKHGGNAPLKSYILVGAWPMDVSDIKVDWSAKDEYEKFDVTWAYDYWIPGVETGGNVFLPEV